MKSGLLRDAKCLVNMLEGTGYTHMFEIHFFHAEALE